MDINKEIYNKQLKNLVGKDIYLKHTEALGIISHVYHEQFKNRNNREETSFVLVGGLSAEIYTAGDYERRRQIKTAAEYIIDVQSPEDIFADRVRAYVNWDEENHIKTLTTLWKLHELDILYIESNLETPEEKAFLVDFQKFYQDSARQSIKLESRDYYINLSDGDIDLETRRGQEYLKISNGIKTPPNEYSRNNGDFATLIGEFDKFQVEFKIDSTGYYDSDSETGFTVYEVTKLDKKPISPKDFIKEYAPHLAIDSKN